MTTSARSERFLIDTKQREALSGEGRTDLYRSEQFIQLDLNAPYCGDFSGRG